MGVSVDLELVGRRWMLDPAAGAGKTSSSSVKPSASESASEDRYRWKLPSVQQSVVIAVCVQGVCIDLDFNVVGDVVLVRIVLRGSVPENFLAIWQGIVVSIAAERIGA